MSTLVLPIEPGEPSFTVEVELSGRLYTLGFDYNTRLAAWSMSIFDASLSPIVQGVRVVADAGLLDIFVDERLPPGQILAVDTSEKGIDPGEDDLGDRVILVYADE
jgi:hypothetical protein